MSPLEEQILIDYLDSNLEGENIQSAEQLISENEEAAKEFEHLQFSVELIREYGLQEQVAAARKEFQATAIVKPFEQQSSGAVVRSLYKNAFRAAAIVLLLLGSAAVYEYAATDSASVFERNYISFDLNTSRGNDGDADIEKAYRNKDWASVLNIFDRQKENSTKSCFLAGMADMELKPE